MNRNQAGHRAAATRRRGLTGTVATLFVIALALLVTACGGGGSSNNKTSASTAATANANNATTTSSSTTIATATQLTNSTTTSSTTTQAAAPKTKKSKSGNKSGEAAGGAIAAGKTIFQTTCGGCHQLADAQTSGHEGPDLDQLKPNLATVKHQVINGGGAMPAFGKSGQLSSKQVTDVAKYVAAVAGKK